MYRQIRACGQAGGCWIINNYEQTEILQQAVRVIGECSHVNHENKSFENKWLNVFPPGSHNVFCRIKQLVEIMVFLIAWCSTIEDKWLDVRPTPKSSNKLLNMSDGSWKVESCTLHEQEYYLREATEILRSAKKQRFWKKRKVILELTWKYHWQGPKLNLEICRQLFDFAVEPQIVPVVV